MGDFLFVCHSTSWSSSVPTLHLETLVRAPLITQHASHCDILTGIAGESVDEYYGEGASGYVNATQPKWAKHYNMFDYITVELPALLEEQFANILEPNKRSIAGHSIGGHGAIMCALKQAELFKSVSAMAPAASLISTFQGQRGFAQYFGVNKLEWAKWDVCELIKSYKGPRMNILVDQGERRSHLHTIQTIINTSTSIRLGR